MGVKLHLHLCCCVIMQELANVLTKQPTLVGLGVALHYTVLPALGFIISR